ncbi:chymotrypsin-2-like [Prorops nasuta]|uniref:chymotrypsin-2-like n=1 Tax=Prorops nasuta TaxID=863751 RepID=UPI0034CD3E93
MAGQKVLMQLACLLAFAALAFADEPEKLVNGRNVYTREFPYMVSIREHNSHFCGGAIIDRRVIATAGHCLLHLVGKSLDSTTVVVGSNSLSYGGKAYKLAKVIIDEKYTEPKNHVWKNDIGVIILASDIEFNNDVQPIKLASKDVRVNEYATISAWGMTSHPKGEVSRRLQKLDLTVISTEKCNSSFHDVNITHDQICTSLSKGSGTCHGDSGSPLAQDRELVGIVSGGIPCAQGYPDVFTRVYKKLEFLNKYITKKHTVLRSFALDSSSI